MFQRAAFHWLCRKSTRRTDIYLLPERNMLNDDLFEGIWFLTSFS